MENLHILLLRLGRSWADASMNQTHALCEAPWNLIPFLRRGSETLHLKVQQRLRLPPTLQEGHRNWGLEEHHHGPRLCKGGWGLRCAAQPPLGLSQENGSLALTAPSDKAPALQGAGASGETLPSAQSNFGRRHTLRANKKLVPAPAPAAALEGCRRTYRGPQNTPSPPAFGISHSKRGQRSQRKTPRRGGPECPSAPAQNVGVKGCSRP